MSDRRLIEPDAEFIEKVRSYGGDTLKKCYQCATCSVVCELSEGEHVFPRKEMLWAQWGMKDRLIGDPDVWLCHQCNDCTLQCPRGARPGDVLAGVRSYVYEHFSFPKFMGKALSKPSALPMLLLAPLAMYLVLLFVIHGPTLGFHLTNLKDVGYGEFLPHLWAEGLFFTGNILVFLFAAIGFLRFWNHMKKNNNGVAPPLISSVIGAIGDVLTHVRFSKCSQNKTRYTAHLLVFYGFMSAFVVGTIVGMAGILHLSFVPAPIPLLHPLKILAIGGGIAMIIGSWMQISRRLNKTDDVGADGYQDRLFLYMILLVAVTGLLTLFARLSGIDVLGYIVYIIHLITVFFLLWYMPYSKFAHMIYRFLAIGFAKATSKK